jgi:AcrR family transcriptional regulator
VQRLSRAEAQAQTRTRVLDAAEDAFAAEGFGGASLDRIAEAAGFTRGAVYSNFADKADLFVAVLNRRLERRSAEVAAAMRSAGDAAAFIDTLHSPAWRASRSDDDVLRWMILHDEFRLFALRNPAAAEHLARYERQERNYYVEATTHLLGQLGVDPPAEPRLLAAVVFALDQGLPRQHHIDPDDVAPTAFADAIELLLESAVALAQRRRRTPAASREGKAR